jgi:hypothetical protein
MNTAELSALRDGINGVVFWGESLLADAAQIELELAGCGLPTPADYHAAGDGDGSFPDDSAGRDWPRLLHELRNGLRGFWDAMNAAHGALDASKELVNAPGSHPVENWSFQLRQRLNSVASWLEATRPVMVAGRRRDPRLPAFVAAVQSGIPGTWRDELARLLDFDARIRTLQNELGIRPGELQAVAGAGAVAELRGGAGGGNHEYLITLQQAAAMVSRSKKTLERRKADDAKFPMPRVAGGGGKPDEYAWPEMRLYLEEQFDRKLPEHFPKSPFV